MTYTAKEVIENLLLCSNAIMGANPQDDEAQEAFDMFMDAKLKARVFLSTLKPEGEQISAMIERCAKIAEAPEIWKQYSGDFEGNCIAAAIRAISKKEAAL